MDELPPCLKLTDAINCATEQALVEGWEPWIPRTPFELVLMAFLVNEMFFRQRMAEIIVELENRLIEKEKS